MGRAPFNERQARGEATMGSISRIASFGPVSESGFGMGSAPSSAVPKSGRRWRQLLVTWALININWAPEGKVSPCLLRLLFSTKTCVSARASANFGSWPCQEGKATIIFGLKKCLHPGAVLSPAILYKNVLFFYTFLVVPRTD